MIFLFCFVYYKVFLSNHNREQKRPDGLNMLHECIICVMGCDRSISAALHPAAWRRGQSQVATATDSLAWQVGFHRPPPEAGRLRINFALELVSSSSSRAAGDGGDKAASVIYLDEADSHNAVVKLLQNMVGLCRLPFEVTEVKKDC